MWWHQRSARRTSANACALGWGVFAAALNPSFSASSPPPLEGPPLLEELVGDSKASISKGATSGESALSATGAPRGCAAPAVAARRDASTARAFPRGESPGGESPGGESSVILRVVVVSSVVAKDAALTARSSGGRVAGARLGTAAIRSPSAAAAASRTRALGCDASASGSSGGAWLARANSSDSSSSSSPRESSRYFRRRRRLASAAAAARSSAVSAASVASVRASAAPSPARQSGVSASTSAESIDGIPHPTGIYPAPTSSSRSDPSDPSDSLSDTSERRPASKPTGGAASKAASAPPRSLASAIAPLTLAPATARAHVPALTTRGAPNEQSSFDDDEAPNAR